MPNPTPTTQELAAPFPTRMGSQALIKELDRWDIGAGFESAKDDGVVKLYLTEDEAGAFASALRRSRSARPLTSEISR